MLRFVKATVLCLCLVLTASLGYAGEGRRPGAKLDALRKAREDRVERREANQKKRIEHGIQKGYLTADEITKLEAEQKVIADMAANFKADGKLTAGEMKQLRSVLHDASLHIWAEKHDTEGNQMPVYRLGKNVFAKSELTDVLQQQDLTGAQARQLALDFHRTLILKHRLATADLTPEQRAKLQTEYNDLLNKYFETR